jgi:anhydro-N-acetylmuramic acid kinase
LKILEKEITLFHAKVVSDLINSAKRSQISSPEIIGFHGQTVFHNPEEKISVQLGDGKLLSQLSKKTVIYNFRKNDLMNGGHGAPLTPIFHKSLKEKIYGNNIPVIFINIGGITNVTCFNSMDKFDKSMFASDIGPGNCLIDEWVRNNTNEKYDKDGIIAKSGKINELILNQALDNFEGNLNSSLDIKDFYVSFARGLSLEDGASTITNFTAEIITTSLKNLLEKNKYDLDNHLLPNFIICGGGRKNKYLMDLLSAKISKKIGYKKFQLIDEHNVDGDFIESEAFAFLAIRSFLNLPISFPNTTGCKEPCTGGVMVKNY